MKTPDLFHYKYPYDNNFTKEENQQFLSNYDNYYIYDSFKLSLITEKSSIWIMEPFKENKDFNEYTNKFLEVVFYENKNQVGVSTIDRQLCKDLSLDV